jgi:hypothetical protein
MARMRWAVLGLYTGLLFLSIPWTRPVVVWATKRLGQGAPVVAGLAALAPAGVALAVRLRRVGAAFPRPHLALAGIALAALASWRLLASSPIALIHMPQYGLLALLAGRAFGGGTAAALGGGAAAAAVGLLDEIVQGATPGRVFDWWDVALNAAAALLGALTLAWWRWTANEARDVRACERQE